MSKSISFHGHEVQSLRIFNAFMNRNRISVPHQKLVAFTIRKHQNRSYPNTNNSTYFKFLIELSLNSQELPIETAIDFYIKFLVFDRVGNLKNKDKPIFTKETLLLQDKLNNLASNLLFTDSDVRSLLEIDTKSLQEYLSLEDSKKVSLLFVINNKTKLFNYKFISSQVKRLKGK